MAGHKHVVGEDKGRVRVRFMEVEIEGSNETLLEGIRQITSAMPSQKIVTRQIIQMPPPAAAALADVSIEEGDDAGHDEMSLFPPAELTATAPAKRRRAPAKPPTVKPIDFNSEMSLQAFCATTTVSASSSQADQALAIAHWLRDQRDTPEMDAGDLYTCLRGLKWPVPDDVSQGMRNLKRQRYVDSGSQAGTWTLTVIGENRFMELQK